MTWNGPRSLLRLACSAALATATVALVLDRPISADQIPEGWSADNMKPIGYSDLDGRGGAFKMAIKHVSNRWYLYLGHLWHHGWTIADVTDPANPKVVTFIPWPNDNTWTIQMELHDNLMVTALQLAGFRMGDRNKPFDEGVLLWDISDPLNPKQLSHWKTGSTGTHRDGYPGGRYANLAANMPGYRGQILVFLDVSDPKNPKEAGRWWLPGQKEGETATGPVGSVHGPAYIEGNRAYVGYGPSVVSLDISDIAKPKLVGRLDFSPPFGGLVVHDVLKVPGKPLLYAHGEGTGGGDFLNGPSTCAAPLYLNGMVDITDETKPPFISQFPLPVPPKDAPYTDFCDKGGRFGPHNTNLEYHLSDVEKQGDLVYETYFNAGLRIVDIKNPRVPREVGWFIPPTPTRRMGPVPEGKLVTQTEDVLAMRAGTSTSPTSSGGCSCCATPERALRPPRPGRPADDRTNERRAAMTGSGMSQLNR